MLSYGISVQTLYDTYNSTSYVINYVHHSNFFVAFFRAYYEGRRADGLKVEKANSIYAKGGYTDKEAERNILSNLFKRFEDMNMMRHTKTLGIVEVDPSVWKKLTEADKEQIGKICDEKLEQYYRRISR